MSRPEVRQRQASDIAALSTALVAVHEVDAYPVEGVHDPADWLQVNHPLGTWTATLDGIPVGHIALTEPGPNDDAAKMLTENDGIPADKIAVLSRLFVSPEARGHKLGVALAQTASRAAHQLGKHAVFDVMEKDETAIRMYESAGCRLLGTFDHQHGSDLHEPARAYVSPPRRPLADGPGWTALSGRDDLAKFGDGNAIALFAAELRLGIDDIETFAADALTDHGNDKKCDLVAVIRDSGQLVIAQAFATKNPATKSAGPANKASDLNTAVSWLLAGQINDLPSVLRDAAIEARDALQCGEINDVQIWSVHNCPEGKNVTVELEQAVKTAQSLLSQYFSAADVNVSFSEIGRETLNDLYKRTQLPILVDKELSFSIEGGFQTAGESWKAYNTAVKLSDLRSLWQEHKTDLLSPNIRDYLGIRKSGRNINYGIKATATQNPEDFYIYNNGVTAMVHTFTPAEDSKQVSVKGIGIVNGGQTTGAIGTLSDGEASSLDEARVQIRFVASSDSGVLANVVRFNNTQNKIEATDFRSTDAVQDRLRTEFEAVPYAVYRGARRGGADDAIARDRTLLPDSTVAQSIASFHGNPNLAYNDLRQIWEHDPTYARFFNDRLHARHIVFCYSLLRAVEEAKQNLNGIGEDQRTTTQKKHAQFFRSRGGIHLLTAAIASSIETILGQAVSDRFALRFAKNVSPVEALAFWRPIVATGLPFTGQLSDATNLGLKSPERVAKTLAAFESMIEATRDSKQETFDTFVDKVEQKASQ